MTTAFGTLNADDNIVVDFDGVLLPAGTYYLTAFVVRQTQNDGIWYWNTSYSGPQALTWKIGLGQPPASETSPFTDQPLALAYTLTGTPVTETARSPEPPTALLLSGGMAFALLLAGRRRSAVQEVVRCSGTVRGLRSDFQFRPQAARSRSD